VTPRVDQFMGNLFFRNVPTSDIKAMKYHELKYWSGWHDQINEAERKAAEAAKIKSGKK